ncbi:LacI family DNA-binding transcriptional regulator [Azospirillum thermophilum]|nr:LacI family DNA-binding transcriptional regulator [Azospirillum thermophilum]
MTIIEVAAIAQVSPSTVSLYCRRPEEVSPSMAERIRKVIDECGYVPNLMAGGLSAGKSRTVAVILPSITNSFFAETYNILQDLLHAAQYQTMLGVSEFNPEREEHLIRAFLAWSPAAIVLTGFEHTEGTRAMLRSAGIPVVETWDVTDAPGVAIDLSVGFSHTDVGRRQTGFLYDQGSRRVAYIGVAAAQDTRLHKRADGYAEEVRQRGLHEPMSLVVTDVVRASIGSRLISEMLDRHPDIDGVACSNDTLALGVLRELACRGLRVPEDVAVIGFGDLTFADSTQPPLTTIRPPQQKIGSIAASQVLSRLRGVEVLPAHQDLDCELVVRASTRKPA